MARDRRGDHYACERGARPWANGLGAGLRAAAAVLPTWNFHDAHGNLLCTTDLTDLWRGVGSCLGVTRMELQRLLVARASTIPYRLGLAVIDLASRAEAVTVEFGDESTREYDLVVGADGFALDSSADWQ